MRQETTNLAAAAQKNAEAPALKPCRVVLMEGLVRGGRVLKIFTGTKDLVSMRAGECPQNRDSGIASGVGEGTGGPGGHSFLHSLWEDLAH